MSRKHTYNQFDAYCKKVLRFKAITAKILQDTLDEFKMLSSDEIIEILNMDNLNDRMNVLNVEDITKSNSKIFYDLQYHIKSGEGIFVDLEPQGKVSKMESFFKRCIHTRSRMVVWQRNEKNGSFKKDYSDLKKCVSIWIVFNAPKKCRGQTYDLCLDSKSEYIHQFPELLNTERIFVMCLHDKIDTSDKSALMMLSVLFGSKITQEERTFILKEEYGILLSEAEKEDLNHMCNAHEGVLEYGKEIGRKDGIEIGRKDGIKIGRKDGIKIGRKDGIKIGKKRQKLESAKSLLMLGASIEMVSKGMELPYETVEKLVCELKH